MISARSSKNINNLIRNLRADSEPDRIKIAANRLWSNSGDVFQSVLMPPGHSASELHVISRFVPRSRLRRLEVAVMDCSYRVTPLLWLAVDLWELEQVGRLIMTNGVNGPEFLKREQPLLATDGTGVSFREDLAATDCIRRTSNNYSELRLMMSHSIGNSFPSALLPELMVELEQSR